MLLILLILLFILAISPHSIDINRNKVTLPANSIEYEFSLTESGLYPLASDNASLFYWYLPTPSPRARSAPLLLWLGDGRVSVMKDVFGEEGPFSITIQQHTLEQINKALILLENQNGSTSEFLFPNPKCLVNNKANTRKLRELDDDEEEELTGQELLVQYSHCDGHHRYHPHCRTTTTTTTPRRDTTMPSTTKAITTTKKQPTTTITTTTTQTTETTTQTTETTTQTTETTTGPSPNTGTTPRPPPPPSVTTPRPPPMLTVSTPRPPIRVDVHKRKIREANTMLQQLLTNIPISLNVHSLLSSYNILYIDSMVGYATGRPSDSILTAVTSLINTLQLYSTNRSITLVASLHMLETLRARNPTELNDFLSLSTKSLKLLQTGRGDRETECLMSACTLRQLSECPRMMALYYWLNEEEGTVREKLGISDKGINNRNGWIPYDNQFKPYSSQSLQITQN